MFPEVWSQTCSLSLFETQILEPTQGWRNQKRWVAGDVCEVSGQPTLARTLQGWRAGDQATCWTARHGGTLSLTGKLGDLAGLMRGVRVGSRLPGSGTALPNMAATSHMGLFHFKVNK